MPYLKISASSQYYKKLLLSFWLAYHPQKYGFKWIIFLWMMHKPKETQQKFLIPREAFWPCFWKRKKTTCALNKCDLQPLRHIRCRALRSWVLRVTFLEWNYFSKNDEVLDCAEPVFIIGHKKIAKRCITLSGPRWEFFLSYNPQWSACFILNNKKFMKIWKLKYYHMCLPLPLCYLRFLFPHSLGLSSLH